MIDALRREVRVDWAILAQTFVTIILLNVDRGACIAKTFERIFSSKVTLNQRTSGRYNQWELFPTVVIDSPVWGFGPGSGQSVYARYALLAEREGWLMGSKKGIVWHSLYLHLAVETGAIGIIALAFIVVPPLFRGFTRARSLGETTPLLGILGFLVIGLSVTGMDGHSGLFLGLGFLGSRSDS